MAGILSGLKSLGLGKLEGLEIYSEEEDSKLSQSGQPKQDLALPTEKDLIYDKSFVCPVCDKQFTSKIMKTGKARLIATDLDLRFRYEGIDSIKYDVVTCPHCAYASLTRYFTVMPKGQVNLIKENICGKAKVPEQVGETYSYEDMMERYKLALACTIVKRGKDSEKAYTCLKSAWLLRGYAESLEEMNDLSDELRKELKEQELEYLQNAFEGFLSAMQKESYPICGMDQLTLDYLIAALAYQLNRDDIAAKLVSSILVSNVASSRVKDRARELKNLILEKHKKDK